MLSEIFQLEIRYPKVLMNVQKVKNLTRMRGFNDKRREISALHTQEFHGTSQMSEVLQIGSN